MKGLMTALVLFAAASAYAGPTHVETRHDYTGKDVPMAIGDCSFPEQYTDVGNQKRIRSTFDLTSCREVKTYQVVVETSGKWYNWSQKVTPIPGTEKLSYEIAQDNKGDDEALNANDAMQSFHVQQTCDSIREGYVTAMNSAGPSKCVAH